MHVHATSSTTGRPPRFRPRQTRRAQVIDARLSTYLPAKSSASSSGARFLRLTREPCVLRASRLAAARLALVRAGHASRGQSAISRAHGQRGDACGSRRRRARPRTPALRHACSVSSHGAVSCPTFQNKLRGQINSNFARASPCLPSRWPRSRSAARRRCARRARARSRWRPSPRRCLSLTRRPVRRRAGSAVACGRAGGGPAQRSPSAPPRLPRVPLDRRAHPTRSA